MPYPLSTKLDSTLRYFNGLYGLATQVTTDIATALSNAASALANITAHIGSTGTAPHGAATSSVNGFMTTAQVTTLGTASSTASTALTNAATAQTQANTATTNAATAQTQANTATTNAATAQSTADAATTNLAALRLRTERAQELAALTSLREVARPSSSAGTTMNGFAWIANATNNAIGAMATVGDGGSIAYATQGRAPQAKSAGSSYTNVFTDIANNNTANLWVAVGFAGEIQTSTDGSTWTRRKTGGNNLSAVAYGAGVFVTVGAAGALFYATDANALAGTWTQVTISGVTVDLAGVICLGSTWVVTTTDGKIYATTTPQTAASWTLVFTLTGTSPQFGVKQIQYHALWGLVALYNRNSTEVGFAISTNGTSWSTDGSVAGPWTNFGAMKFALLDRSVIIFDAQSSSPSDMWAAVYQAASTLGASKIVGMLAKVSTRMARGVAGQLVVCGQDTSGPGVLLMGAAYRPNSYSE